MLSSSGRCDVSPDLSGKLSLWPQKYNLLVLLCPHKSTTCYFVSLDLQTCKIPHLRYIWPSPWWYAPAKREKDDVPQKAWRRLFLCTKRFLYEIYCINCIKKDARALMYPVFRISRKPFIYWCFRFIGLPFLCRWLLPFLCRWNFLPKSLCLSGFYVFLPPKKVCPFCVAGKITRNPFK